MNIKQNTKARTIINYQENQKQQERKKTGKVCVFSQTWKRQPPEDEEAEE